MDINIPTDNMYKYLAVLCTIIFIVCIMSNVLIVNAVFRYSNQEYQDMMDWTIKITQQDFRSEIKEEPDSFFAKYWEIRTRTFGRFLKYGKIILFLICVIGLLSVVIGIKAYIFWYNKDQKLKDKLLELDFEKRKREINMN